MTTRFTRRALIKTVGLATAASLALAGCSSGSEPASGEQVSTVRVALIGGPGDTLDIGNAQTMLPYGVLLNVCDSLAVLSGDSIKLQLAESVTPNADATEWTIKLRDDAIFHHGQPVTAADALFSMGHHAQSANTQGAYQDVDFSVSHVVDDQTLVVALKRPRADFVEGVISSISTVIPAGTTDFTDTAIGSGPFKLESFDPATGAVLVRNDDYWGGAPQLERIELVPIVDDSARLSALTDGQIDYASQISVTGAETLDGNSGFAVSNQGAQSAAGYSFTMNTAMAPFDDPEVREAMKLAVDRQQLLDVVLRGQGELGNDLVGQGLTGYAPGIEQRQHDAAKAEQIFKAKGVTELSIVVAELGPGLTDSVKLLQQQLGDLGVELTIREADPTTLFSDLTPVWESQLFATYFANRPAAVTLPMFMAADSPMNFSQWKDQEFNDALVASQNAVDDAERAQLLDQAQERLQADGGLIVWGYLPVLDAHASGIFGVEANQSVPLFGKAAFTK